MSKARAALGICVVSTMFAGVTVAEPAYASVTSKPPTNWSYYVHPGDTGDRAQRLGCGQAKADNIHRSGSFVILDFGAQRSNGRGTYLPSTTVYWTNAADENYALHFAYGYQSCHPRHFLILAVGTSNGGAVTNGALGAAWGALVQSVAKAASARGYSRVWVQGGIDAEPGYGTFAHFQAWEWGDKTGRGYVSRTTALLDDYGSADGCPQGAGKNTNLRCANGWNTADEYNAVWGWSPNEATPEIYYDGCRRFANQASQWANVSAYGRRYGRKGMVKFVGPLDQGNCLSSARSWTAFQSALARAGVTRAMKYSLEMVTK